MGPGAASLLFVAGWAALLAYLALLPRLGGSGRGGTLPPLLAASFAVLALGAMGLQRSAGTSDPTLEPWIIRIGDGDAPVTVGTSPRCDVVLQDVHGAPFHALVSFTDRGPTIRSLTADRRLERNGVDIHHVALTPGTEIALDGQRWTVQRVGRLLPGLVLRSDDGSTIRLRPHPLRRLAGTIPVVGPRYEVAVATLEQGGVGLVRGRLTHADGPVAEIALRGRTALLRFPTPADRHAHRVTIRAPGEEPVRPEDRAVLLSPGDLLTLGYTRYRVTVDADGALVWTVRGLPPRVAFDPGDGVLAVGPGGELPHPTGSPVLLQARRGDEPGSLTLISTDPGWTVSPLRGFVWLHPTDGPREGRAPVTLRRGSGLILTGPRHEVVYRYRVPTSPGALLSGGEPGTPEHLLVRAAAAAAVLYLLLTVVLWASGTLHTGNAAVLHGPALLVAIALPLLADLSPPGDPRVAGVAARQAAYVAAGLGAGLLVAVATWARGWGRRRPARPGVLWRSAERPVVRRAPGPLGSLPRIWLLWLAAAGALALQLPFGETGIPLPLVGSLQPVEAAKTAVTLLVALLGARAMEDQRLRPPRPEGPRQRWRYMVHAVPLLAIAALCFGLDDVSPVVVLALFCWAMYLLTLVRPARRVWPPRELLHSVYAEQALLAVLAGVGVWASASLGDGTVAERLRAWLDPWSHTATSGQFVSSLWLMVDGGVLGKGLGAPFPPLPAAAHDDFVLAVLVHRAGLAGAVLLAATYVEIIAVGLAATAAAGPRSRPDLAGAGLLLRARVLGAASLSMLAVQVAVVAASVTGGAPVMGQPLPFVSAGGSHLLLFAMPMVALTLAATRRLPRNPGTGSAP